MLTNGINTSMEHHNIWWSYTFTYTCCGEKKRKKKHNLENYRTLNFKTMVWKCSAYLKSA